MEFEKVRLMIVDDHVVVRQGLAALFRNQEWLDVVAEAGDGSDALDAYTRARPDVVLMELRLKRSDGVEALKSLKAHHRKAQILILSGMETFQDVAQARRLGACGFVSKEVECHELCHASRTLWEGCQYWDAKHEEPECEASSLSAREIEVLEAARRGLSNSDIGRALCISEHTVKSHVKTLLKKLHAADRTEAVARGFELGMLR